jgi:hypothetical protein
VLRLVEPAADAGWVREGNDGYHAPVQANIIYVPRSIAQASAREAQRMEGHCPQRYNHLGLGEFELALPVGAAERLLARRRTTISRA